MKDKREIIKEVKSKTDLIRYPFDEFWFLEGYDLAKEEINEQIELARQSGYNEACFVKEKEFLKEMELIQSEVENLEYAEYNDTETRISALIRIYKIFKELKKGVLKE